MHCFQRIAYCDNRLRHYLLLSVPLQITAFVQAAAGMVHMNQSVTRPEYLSDRPAHGTRYLTNPAAPVTHSYPDGAVSWPAGQGSYSAMSGRQRDQWRVDQWRWFVSTVLGGRAVCCGEGLLLTLESHTSNRLTTTNYQLRRLKHLSSGTSPC